jgi:hypothetical protein
MGLALQLKSTEISALTLCLGQNRSGSVLVVIRFWIGQGGCMALNSWLLLVADAPNHCPLRPRGLRGLGFL